MKRRARNIEIKTVDSNAYCKWQNAVPLMYYCSITALFIIVSELYQFGYFAILIGGNRLEIIPIEKDEEYIKEQEQQLINFWTEHVIKRIPPPLTVNDLNKIVPKNNSSIEANSETIKLFNELIDNKK